MATTAGQRFIRKQVAARGTTSNTTAADISYDTAVLSEGGYSWAGNEVTVDETARYLCIFDIGQANLSNTRSCGTLVPAINSVDQPTFRATHRYLRNSGGALEGASIGSAILSLSANDKVKVRNPGSLTPTDAYGSYATDASRGGAIQLVRLPDGNLTYVARTVDANEVGTSDITTTRPWLDSSGTWTRITFNSEVVDDDALYPGSGGLVTLKAGRKYLINWGATLWSADGSRHTYVIRLQIAGVNVQTGSGYQRNTSSQAPPITGMHLYEVGASDETVQLQATHETEGGDAGTPAVSDAYLQVQELPTSAEWAHADNGATDTLTTALVGTATWYDTPLSSLVRADGGGNLSLNGAGNAVRNDSGGPLPVLAVGWHRWDRDLATSSTRKTPWTRWSNGGSVLGYATAGAYSRGQQGSDDTFQAHYCSGALMDLASSANLTFQVSDPASASNGDMGIYASTNRHFLGVQVLDLGSLLSTGTPAEIAQVSDPLVLATTAQSVQADIDTQVGQSTDSLVLATTAQSVQADIDTQVGQSTDSLVLATTAQSVQAEMNTDVLQSTDSLVLATTAQSVQADIDTQVGQSTDSLVLATTAQSVQADIDTQVGQSTDSLVLATTAQSVQAEVNTDVLQSPAGLVIVEEKQTVSAGFDNVAEQNTNASLVLAGVTQQVRADIDTQVSQTLDALVVSTTQQAVRADMDSLVGQSADSLVLGTTGQTVKADTDVVVAQVESSLSLTATGQLVKADADAVVGQTPDALLVGLTRQAVKADTDTTVAQGLTGLLLVGHRQNIRAGIDTIIAQTPATLTLVAPQQQVTQEEGVLQTPATLTLVETPQAVRANTDSQVAQKDNAVLVVEGTPQSLLATRVTPVPQVLVLVSTRQDISPKVTANIDKWRSTVRVFADGSEAHSRGPEGAAVSVVAGYTVQSNSVSYIIRVDNARDNLKVI